MRRVKSLECILTWKEGWVQREGAAGRVGQRSAVTREADVFAPQVVIRLVVLKAILLVLL